MIFSASFGEPMMCFLLPLHEVIVCLKPAVYSTYKLTCIILTLQNKQAIQLDQPVHDGNRCEQ